MWKRIKRIFKMALLLPVLVAFGKGTYEDAPDPELLYTPEQEEAISGLEDLAYGDLPTLPTMNLEDIEPYNIGMDEIKKVLGETYDPFKSPFYQGLREASMREEEAGVSNLRRRSQLGGMLKSDPSRRTEAEYRNTQIGIQQALLPYTAQAPLLQGLAGGYGTLYSPEQIYQPGLLDYAAPIIGGILSFL